MEFTKDDYPNASTPLHPAFARPPLHIIPSATTFHFANNSDTINIPQKGLIGNASRLRNFRKYCTKTHLACGTSANIIQKCFLFAELPQTLHKGAFCLRNFRKYNTKTLLACGISANIVQKCILFAELPQMLHKSAFCLRNFRKYDTKTHLACGTSANSMQIKNTPYYIIAPFAR